jgi:hypothetical protein
VVSDYSPNAEGLHNRSFNSINEIELIRFTIKASWDWRYGFFFRLER